MTASRVKIVVRQWRITEASPSGCHVWFDPARETLELWSEEPPEDSGVDDVLEGDDQIRLGLTPSSINDPPEEDLPF